MARRFPSRTVESGSIRINGRAPPGHAARVLAALRAAPLVVTDAWQRDSRSPRWADFLTLRDFVAAHEAHWDAAPSSNREILARAARLADQAIRAIEMQIRRLNAREPEDDEWITRPLVDARFLVDALWTLRLAASVAQVVPGARGQVKRAVKAFGQALPCLQRIRNVYQHMDNYKTDHPTMRRQRLRANGKVIGRRLLEVDAWSNEGFSWLGEVVRFDEALAAAWDLVRVLRQVRDERTESD